MKTRAALVALLLFSACARFAPLDQSFEQARQAMWRGDFRDAQQLADAGAARASDRRDTAWQWRFKLLGTEVAILRRDFDAAESALGSPIPDGNAFDALRA